MTDARTPTPSFASGFVTGTALVALLALGGLLIERVQTAGPPEAELTRATIVHVEDTPEWCTPTTLVEYEDGRRANVTGYYGQPGDTFLLERRAR